MKSRKPPAKTTQKQQKTEKDFTTLPERIEFSTPKQLYINTDRKAKICHTAEKELNWRN